MDMESRNQYLEVLRGRYLRAKAKKEKSQILDEYCRNTGQARKYVIRKIQPGLDLRPKPRSIRHQTESSRKDSKSPVALDTQSCLPPFLIPSLT